MLHRWTRAALAVPLSLALAASAQAATVDVGGLRLDNRSDQPLGVDDATPALSLTLTGSGANARQTAYEIEATDATGALPNFPVDFTIRTGTSSTPATIIKTVTDQPNRPVRTSPTHCRSSPGRSPPRRP